MKVRLFVNKTAALKAGKDKHGSFVVEVPAASLTDAQRETLSHCYDTKDDADFSLVDHLGGRFNIYGESILAPTIAEATPEVVPSLLDSIAEQVAAVKAAQEEKKRKEEEAHQAKLAAWQAKPLEERIRKPYSTWEPTWDRGDLRTTPAYLEAKAECERRNAAEKAERERQEAERKAKVEAGKAALRSWAETHGSDLLKARIAEGFEFEGLAQKEFASSIVEPLTADFEESAETPDGYELDEFQSRTTPTLEEIQALRTLRQRFEGKPATVDLKWAKYDPQESEDDYDDDKPEQLQRAELVVTVTCPNGSEREFYFLPATAKTAAK